MVPSVTQRHRAILASFSLNRTGQYIAPVFPVNFTFSGFTKGDVFVSYERTFDERFTMTFFGGADNVFNERYFENGFLAPGIIGRGGINFRF